MWTPSARILSSGLVEEAYARYGLRARQGGTYLATFRAVAKKYSQKPAAEILADLMKTTPGEDGKWFTAARDLGHYDLAIELARTSPCDPKTLARTARDYATRQPVFAVEAAHDALEWLVKGYGYEIWRWSGLVLRLVLGFGASQPAKRRTEHRLICRRIARQSVSLPSQHVPRPAFSTDTRRPES